MSYPSYLVHFNQNHSAKNGQFISGDGDGDGIVNDHKNQKTTTTKKKGLSTGAKVALGVGGAIAGTAAITAAALVGTSVVLGKKIFDEYGDTLLDTAGWTAENYSDLSYLSKFFNMKI